MDRSYPSIVVDTGSWLFDFSHVSAFERRFSGSLTSSHSLTPSMMPYSFTASSSSMYSTPPLTLAMVTRSSVSTSRSAPLSSVSVFVTFAPRGYRRVMSWSGLISRLADAMFLPTLIFSECAVPSFSR